MGYNTRSGEYTRSRYFETLAHKNPRVKGCAGSHLIFVARPSSTVIRTPQASGQSCGQAAWTTCFISPDYRAWLHAGGRVLAWNLLAQAEARSRPVGALRVLSGLLAFKFCDLQAQYLLQLSEFRVVMPDQL